VKADGGALVTGAGLEAWRTHSDEELMRAMLGLDAPAARVE
jgi:hypothetical protein